MRQKKQNQQLELTLNSEGDGETASAEIQGVEPLVVSQTNQSPALKQRLMEAICQRENLERAWKQVKSNQGSPGVDGLTINQTRDYVREHWSMIREQLLQGIYQPKPVRRAEIEKPGGGIRKLGIPTVLDRLIQQAILQVLQAQWDPTFSEHSYGFRPGRSAHQAVAQAQHYVAQGYRYVVDIDLEKFFDRVNHDLLMSRVARRVGDKRLLKLIRAFLNAGVMDEGLVSPTEEGTPQGGPLSPLLSNLLLDDFDQELAKRGHRFCRYADDCNIYVRSQRAGERVMESACRFLTTKLRLKVNEAKSAVANPQERQFLGFTISQGEPPKRWISTKALKRFEQRIREITKRTRGASVAQIIKELRVYLVGWRGYFGYCQTPRTLGNLESRIRRRLRMFIWRQWGNGPNRYTQLRRLGIGHDQAAVAAGSPTGFWSMSRHVIVQKALNNAYFDSLGLPRLVVAQEAQSKRIAVVRPRMPGGVGGGKP